MARNFANNFSDYQGEQYLLPNKYLASGLESQIRSVALNLLGILERKYVSNTKDFTVYTGTAGLALMYYHLFTKSSTNSKRVEYLSKAAEYILLSLNHLKASDITFLCGAAGPLAIAAVIYHAKGNVEDAQYYLHALLDLGNRDVFRSSISDELLYGRVGFLYALLFVKHHISDNAVSDGICEKIADAILDSGQRYAHSRRMPVPLMYEWYGTLYLGAAHGVSGIISILLSMRNSGVVASHYDKIRSTIDYLMTLKFPSGNYPAAIESHSSDELVHWCHGAPGWIYMFIAAFKTFRDQKYLMAAEECSNVIWRRGLLRKGYGLCHGVAGNAYSFLALYNLTGNEKHLYRALKFAEWIFDYGKHGCRIADNPYSLFEGMAGTIYFLFDTFYPKEAKFPGFEL